MTSNFYLIAINGRYVYTTADRAAAAFRAFELLMCSDSRVTVTMEEVTASSRVILEKSTTPAGY